MLPENESDRHMATLLCLQTTKSLSDNLNEKRLNLINQPVLPGTTITSFGGLKRERLLNLKLKPKDLGIVKRQSPASSISTPSASSSLDLSDIDAEKDVEDNRAKKTKLQSEDNLIIDKETPVAKSSIDENTFKKINTTTKLSLVGDYNSSSCTSESDDNM